MARSPQIIEHDEPQGSGADHVPRRTADPTEGSRTSARAENPPRIDSNVVASTSARSATASTLREPIGKNPSHLHQRVFPDGGLPRSHEGPSLPHRTVYRSSPSIRCIQSAHGDVHVWHDTRSCLPSIERSPIDIRRQGIIEHAVVTAHQIDDPLQQPRHVRWLADPHCPMLCRPYAGRLSTWGWRRQECVGSPARRRKSSNPPAAGHRLDRRGRST